MEERQRTKLKKYLEREKKKIFEKEFRTQKDNLRMASLVEMETQLAKLQNNKKT